MEQLHLRKGSCQSRPCRCACFLLPCLHDGVRFATFAASTNADNPKYLDLLHPLLTAVNISWLLTLLSLPAFHPLMQRLRQPEEVPGHLHLRLAL